ncbi:MAG: hypothetical protein AVDCRST_MAG67-522 [uncultured Solirubrobacteraceae bacterium]|uniref:Transport permease protein n=1 Tax=uncultured Solirubrobacteraceae bacterium TaxID=1162706 RepID=A0A6J4RL44_9ACTN|nr:MAG: hypothetical protein AVDCRST_MAG67-522 [uncultured Solirubrobacteraceae bacterium]
MTRVRAYTGAGAAVLRRDFQTALSYRLQLIGTVFGSFVSLTIFYYVSRLVRVEPFESPDEYFAFVLVGLVIFAMLQALLGGAPVIVRQELVAGTFARVVLSPLGPVAGICAMLLFPFAIALVTGTVTLLFGVAAFGVDLDLPRALLGFPVAFLAALSFAPFGLLSACLVLIVKQSALGVGLLLAAISLVSGLYFPVDLLPGWIGWAADVQPFTPAVDLMRHLLVNAEMQSSPSVALLKLAAFGAAMLPLSLWLLAQTIGFTRRRGTIIEY